MSAGLEGIQNWAKLKALEPLGDFLMFVYFYDFTYCLFICIYIIR